MFIYISGSGSGILTSLSNKIVSIAYTLWFSTNIWDNVKVYSFHHYVENKCRLSKFYKRSDEFSSIWKISIYFFCRLFSTIWKISVDFKVYTYSPRVGQKNQKYLDFFSNIFCPLFLFM